jgi:drug/metabolite transporter (DMT)-like permease
MSQALGVLAALAAAVLYSIGVTLQSIEARNTPESESLRPSLIRDLLARKRWLIGTACVVGGWFMQAVALMNAPITVVQPALAVSVVALLFIGARWFGERVRPKEILAALAITIGVGGLVAASPGHSDSHAAPLTLALGMTVLGAIALAPFLLKGRKLGGMISLGAGIAYAWTGFSTKFLADSMADGSWVVALLWLAATVGAAGVGLLSEMTALQSRSAIRVFPVVLVTQIVVAVLLAPLLAGESWSPDPLVIAGLGVSLAIVAAATRALAGATAVEAAIATAAEPA